MEGGRKGGREQASKGGREGGRRDRFNYNYICVVGTRERDTKGMESMAAA